ncbi:parallel beta helix pectate lyase-like protein [Rahnella aquatilis]|nr:parallel beta helix pectate lyase-like protein [Rahnella aquatilis]
MRKIKLLQVNQRVNENRRSFLTKMILILGGASLMPRLAFAVKDHHINQDWLIEQEVNSKRTGQPIDGQGGTIFVSKPLILTQGKYKNINFTPAKGYFGPGPVFFSKDNFVYHENISIIGFAGPGCKVVSSTEGHQNFKAVGLCRYNENGRLKRTKLIKPVNLKLTNKVFVEDVSEFKVDDFIWIGDGKFKISFINGNQIVLDSGGISNIIGPKVFNGGKDNCDVGQFVTLDADDRNGIRIGNGKEAWNIDTTQSKIECINNAWFGFFHYSKRYQGKQIIENIQSIGNGYCGIGLGYMNDGYVKNCRSEKNGNNGIDIFESKSNVIISNNNVSDNGVDGIFVGGDGETAEVFGNNIINNRRIGLLINARNSPIRGLLIKNNNIVSSGMNSLTLTGVSSGNVINNTLDGSKIRSAIFLEKRNGMHMEGGINLLDNIISNSMKGDVSTNYDGYSIDGKAKILIQSKRKLLIKGIDGY